MLRDKLLYYRNAKRLLRKGLEPLLLKKLDSKSNVYTNFTILVFLITKHIYKTKNKTFFFAHILLLYREIYLTKN